MENQKEQEQQTNELEDTIKVIKEEYETQIKNLKEEHKKEIEQIKKEEHDKTVQTIRAIMSGKQEEIQNQPASENELSFEEQLILDTKKKLGITKGGN